MARAGTQIFRVALWDESAVYRDIEVDAAKSLYHLAEAIVRAFDFDLDHCFGFYSGKKASTIMLGHPKYELFADIGEETDAKSVKKTKIANAFPETGRTMAFLFDYGDNWLFRVEMIGAPAKAAGVRYPRVLATKGTAPEQYPAYDEEDDGA